MPAPSSRSVIHATALVALTLAATLWSIGCESVASVKHLRAAQSAFSEAAAIENEQAIEVPDTLGDPSEPAGALAATAERAVAARAGYASALAELDALGAEGERRLAADDLLGTARTLRALTLWRLGRFEEALAAVDATVAAEQSLRPRDRASLAALPGLIRIDLARTATEAALVRLSADPDGTPTKAEVLDSVRDRIEEATAILGEARESISSDHPMQVYLVQSRLAAFRNYQYAYEHFGPGAATVKVVPADDPLRVQATEDLRALEEFPEIQTGDLDPELQSKIDMLVDRWRTITGLAPAPPPSS